MINIYKITNIENGKIYIGRTKLPIEKRWKQHVWAALRNVEGNYFRRAIRKHGKDNFTVELLEQCDPSIQHEREVHYIKANNSLDETIGYNTNWGASGSNGDLQLKTRLSLGEASKKFWNSMTPEQRSQLLSKRMTGIKFNESHKKNLSKTKRGTKNNGASKYLGVSLDARQPRCIFYYPHDSIDIRCNTEIEAAELWDQITCCVYGDKEKLNFPERLIQLTTDKIISKIRSYFSRFPKSRYKHVSFSKGYYSVWSRGKFVKKFREETDAIAFARAFFKCEEGELLRPPSSLDQFESFLRHYKGN